MTLPPRNYAKRGSDKRLRSATHRKFVREHLCVALEKGDCSGPIDCCHNRDECPEYGMGIKPSDLWCYSACRKHAIQAEKREGAFGRECGIDVLALCIEFASKSPDKVIKEAAAQYRAVLLVRNIKAKAAEL